MSNSTLFPFKTINLKDQDISRIQSNITQTFNSILNKKILDGQLLEDIDLTTSFQNIEHKLNRAVIGYIVVKRNADSRVWDNEANNTKKELFLTLKANVSVTVSLWIF